MLGVRRALAVVLATFAVLFFFVALFAGRIDATLLNPNFLLRHAEDAGIYEVFRDEGIPALVDDFVEEQDEDLAENMAGMDLPTDPESRARIAEALQTLLPPEWAQAATEEVVSGVLPYMLGKTDRFEVDVSLHDPLVATFGASPGERSVFEAMWLDLNLSERLIRGFSERAVEDDNNPSGGDRQSADGRGPDDEPKSFDESGLLAILSEDIEGAAEWWDEEFLGLISGMLPYLVGDSGHFDLDIDFTDYPPLAYAFAGPLQTDAETLQSDGWRFTDRDLAEKLADAEDVSIEDIDEWLAIFRTGGATFDEQDLRDRLDEQQAQARAAGREVSGLQELDQMRRGIRLARMAATWGAGLLTAALIVGVAFLGGQSWTSRLRWGSAALLAASLVSLVIVTPVYAAAGSSRIDTWLDEQRLDTESPLPAPVRARLVDAGRDAIGDIVGGMQWRALFWFVLAAAGITLSVALDRPRFREGVRRRLRGRSGPPAGDTTLSPADAPTGSEPAP